MKRVFSHPVTALVIGLAFRLFFALRLPSSSGDGPLYEALASNWFHHGIYGIPVNGVLTPLDIRMPGYPAYLALIQAMGLPASRWSDPAALRPKRLVEKQHRIAAQRFVAPPTRPPASI